MALTDLAPTRTRTGTVTKRLRLFAGRAHPALADSVAAHLGVRLTPQSAYEFANGEVFVRFAESVRGCDAFVLHATAAPIDQWLLEQLIMVDALKRASAKRITVVMPCYPYARQDHKHRGREPVTARLVADLVRTAGADRVMTVDLHAAQIQGFFDGPVDHLLAHTLLADHIQPHYRGRDITVVAPDAGRVRLAEKWADHLGGTPIAFLHKTRDPRHPDATTTNRVVGEVTGRLCVVVDDMIDTGHTVADATRALLATGATEVIATATHGVLSHGATARLAACGVGEVVLTDTLPIPEDPHCPQLTVLSIAPLLARAIHEVFDDGSVTSLFDGHA
ncbi:ribose-phosphate diphosphokinase [Kutzneria viridogrisea]|uniref:ribose-phosphate diphosphokinase n=2 Tax=Kutzneria TaxID=43356 RepID=W5WCC9_9PSEU|nr:ribose-phosphate diphosphokinase [Kutzneria albida]AHH98818.1 hypothetical protein KALB_5456 [Kutzneria albida DSM 43870]MBA8923662.1 ribose-phosphate pyrophosphokinase [Kutzneria viridogrisea]